MNKDRFNKDVMELKAFSEFNKAEIKWAESILNRPAYIMPSGKSSHIVACDVMMNVIDRSLDEGTAGIRWNGKDWEFTV